MLIAETDACRRCVNKRVPADDGTGTPGVCDWTHLDSDLCSPRGHAKGADDEGIL